MMSELGEAHMLLRLDLMDNSQQISIDFDRTYSTGSIWELLQTLITFIASSSLKRKRNVRRGRLLHLIAPILYTSTV